MLCPVRRDDALSRTYRAHPDSIPAVCRQWSSTSSYVYSMLIESALLSCKQAQEHITGYSCSLHD